MTVTLGANVMILHMLPVFVGVRDPIITIAIIATFTDCATAVFT